MYDQHRYKKKIPCFRKVKITLKKSQKFKLSSKLSSTRCLNFLGDNIFKVFVAFGDHLTYNGSLFQIVT